MPKGSRQSNRREKGVRKTTTSRKGTKKQVKRSITRDQFHSLVKKAAQPTKKPKSGSGGV